MFFFFSDTATTEIYTLSLHDALPICREEGIAGAAAEQHDPALGEVFVRRATGEQIPRDRKSTRLNSSHTVISYAVFCLKKKKQRQPDFPQHIIESDTTLAEPDPRTYD